MSKWTKKTIALLILTIISLVWFGYVLSIYLIVKNNKNKLEYESISITTESKVFKYLDENRNYSYLNNNLKEIRTEAEDLVGLHFYIYLGKDVKSIEHGAAWGVTNFYFRTITVAEKIGVGNYIHVIVHELVHLKYYNANEMWTNFMTFKLLYESDNPDFKQVAINYAYRYISSHTIDEKGNLVNTNWAGNLYDMSYYIINYLEAKIDS